MRIPRGLLLALAAVAAAVLVGWLVTRAGPAAEPAVTIEGPAAGAALSAEERAALAGPPVEPGQPAAADPAVQFDDPESVARAYLVAAHSHDGADADRTNRRAAPYAVPGGTSASVGVLVLDPPPAGQVSTVTVIGLELLETTAAGDRRGYRADYQVTVGAAGELAPPGPTQARYLALVHQSDGRWLVAFDTADPPAGEE